MTYDTGLGSKPLGSRNIGLFGGTFDPPHLGHLVAAEAVRDSLRLDEVRLVVASVPWQKEGSRPITEPARRVAMVQAALTGAPGLVCSDVEVRLGGPSYSAVTLEELDRCEPGTTWHLILGADAAAGLETWHRPGEVRRRSRLVVAARPGSTTPPPAGWDHVRVEVPLIGVSSTMIRDAVAAGRSIRYLCPDPVIDLIRSWRLYRPPA